jgi:UDP-N-acetylglucosamine acyltransferase
MYRLLYRQGLSLQEAQAAMQTLRTERPEAAADIDLMLNFLAGSKPRVGIVRGRARAASED